MGFGLFVGISSAVNLPDELNRRSLDIHSASFR